MIKQMHILTGCLIFQWDALNKIQKNNKYFLLKSINLTLDSCDALTAVFQRTL